jgi:outer membrane lipoprotein-sorting protein
MKKTLYYIILSIIFISSFSPDEATNILKKVDKALSAIKDKTANVEMQMINLKSGKKKIKKAVYYQKGLDKKLFKYTYPKSDEGIATLNIPGEVYLYLPMFKKPKKITNIAESNRFNKSDFSLEDMNNKSYVELFTAKKLADETPNYVLDLKPKDSESPYSHIVAYFNKEHYYVTKFEYFDSKNIKLKVAIYDYINIESHWVVSTVSMTNLKKNHRSIFIMTDIRINTGLSDEVFTVENMLEK